MRDKVEIRFKLETSYSDIIINYQLSQKFKLFERVNVII